MNKQNIAVTAIPTSLAAATAAGILLNDKEANAQSFEQMYRQIQGEREQPALDPELRQPEQQVAAPAGLDLHTEPAPELPAAGLGTDFSLMLSGTDAMKRLDLATSFDLGGLSEVVRARGYLNAGVAKFNPYTITVELPFGDVTDSTFVGTEGFYGQAMLGLDLGKVAQVLAGYTHLELGENIHCTHATPAYSAGLRFNLLGMLQDSLDVRLGGLYTHGDSGDYQSAIGDGTLQLRFDDNWSAFLQGNAAWARLKGDNEQVDVAATLGGEYRDDTLRARLGAQLQYSWARILNDLGSVVDGSGRFGTIPGNDLRRPWVLGIDGEVVITPFEDKNWELVISGMVPLANFGPGDDELQSHPQYGATIGIRYRFGGSSERSQTPYLPRTTGASSTYGKSIHRPGVTTP